MVGLHGIKNLSLVVLVFSLSVVSSVDAASRSEPSKLARCAQFYALVLRMPFFMAAQHHQAQNNLDAAAKSKAIASGLSLLSELLDLYNNGKTDRCLYNYPWAAYDLYEMAAALYSLMNPQEVLADAALLNDPAGVVDPQEQPQDSKIVNALIMLETFFRGVSAYEIDSYEAVVAMREMMRSLQSLTRCGTEFFSGDKKSYKSILLAIAALASTYDILKLADVLGRNKRSNGSGSSYGNSGYYGNTGGASGSGGSSRNTPQAPSPAEIRRRNLEVLGLQEGVSDAEIRRAYLQLAKQFHPDKNPDNPQESEVEFKRCKAAHDALLRK